MPNPIKTTKDLIGDSHEDDNLRVAVEHAKNLEQDAPELSSLVAGSKIQSIVGRYISCNENAIEKQDTFKWWSASANWSVLLTATLSALLIASPGILLIANDEEGYILGQEPSYLVVVLMALSIISGSWGAVSFSILKRKQLLTRWMESRAEAEENRLEFFNRIADSESNKGTTSAVAQALQKFEFFRRYQLENQFDYYTWRGKKHDKRSSVLLTLSALAMGVVVASNGFAGAFGTNSPQLTVIASLAVIFQSAAAMISNTESIEQNQRNAERYERTGSALNKLLGKLDEVREGIAEGELKLFPNFVKAVHEVLSVEHRQWLANLEHRQTAINELEIQLDELKKKKSD